MWKKFSVCIFGLFLSGCVSHPETREISPRIPSHVILQNQEGKPIGIGVRVQDNVFVTADHLRERYGDVFWHEQRGDVISRDFENDLLFFSFDGWPGSIPDWSDTPPVVGGEIFWLDEFSALEKQRVKALSQTILEDSIQENRIILSGSSQLPNSGSPVFDSDGKVFGILVGGDKENNVSFAIRGDKVVKILKEHLE